MTDAREFLLWRRSEIPQIERVEARIVLGPTRKLALRTRSALIAQGWHGLDEIPKEWIETYGAGS